MKNFAVYAVAAAVLASAMSVWAAEDAQSPRAPERKTVAPETPTVVELSASDINRIVCSKDIQDSNVAFSREKGVDIQFSGRNVFIKFKAKRGSDGAWQYSNTPTELYVVCDERVYEILALPKRIPAATVTLSAPVADKAKKNMSLFRNMPHEDKLMRVIQQVYKDDFPETYSVVEVNQEIPIFKNADFRLRRTVVIEGEGIRVREYAMRVDPSAGIKGFRISESDFMKPEIVLRPAAISIDRVNIGKGEVARVIVVERVAGNES